MVDGVWNFGRSRQLSQNKFLDPSSPSMRKGCDGEEKKWKIMTFIVATNFVASRLAERRPTGAPHALANKLIINPLAFVILVELATSHCVHHIVSPTCDELCGVCNFVIRIWSERQVWVLGGH